MKKRLLTIVICLLGLGNMSRAEESDLRAAVPAMAEQAEASKLIREIYAQQIEAAKSREDRSALARQIFAIAAKEPNLPNRYALLFEARRLAGKGHDVTLLLDIIDQTAAVFQIDRLSTKASALWSLTRSGCPTATKQAAATASIELIEQAVGERQFDIAEKLCQFATTTARSARDYSLTKRMASWEKQVAQLREQYAKFQEASIVLKQSPNDPQANLTVGRWHTFAQRDWETGLEHLALGSDATLKSLAERDLVGPTLPKDQIELGDDWWKLSESTDTADSDVFKQLAARHYQASLSTLSGIAKHRVEKRLGEAMAREQRTDSGPSAVKKFTNSIGQKLVRIPAGEFQMGSSKLPYELSKIFGSKYSYYFDQLPQHRVLITQSFYIGVYEVTLGQFQQFVEATGYKTTSEEDNVSENLKWNAPGYPATTTHPVSCVSWHDVQAFLQWLSEKEERRYRLPTEAEWEYACRARTTGLLSCEEYSEITKSVWFNVTMSKRPTRAPQQVGLKKPNPWGLYDIHGNVWEWCQDWYGATYYKNSPVNDPTGSNSGTHRICRGGSWDNRIRDCRSAHRNKILPTQRYPNIGFRLVLIPSDE